MQESLQRNDQREAHARIFAKDHDQEEKPFYWNERSEDHNKSLQKVEAIKAKAMCYTTNCDISRASKRGLKLVQLEGGDVKVVNSSEKENEPNEDDDDCYPSYASTY